MALNTIIQLTGIGYLDLTEDIVIPLNFAVAEIQDISKRQGGYSKTITLLGTPNNNNIFSHLFDVNVADTSFNQNFRQECVIIQNGLPVFDGYLQLLNVSKRAPSQGNPDEVIVYECQVKDTTGDFYSVISDRLLTDLTGFTQYNHTYNIPNILATSGNTWQDVYKYHLTYNLNPYYTLQDFAPDIFAKAYFDRIFQQAGYTYSWTGLTSTGFDKLVIPYNGDKPQVNLSNYQFNVGFSSNTSTVFLTNTNKEPLIFSEETTLPYFDNNNDYDNTTGIYTSSFIGESEFKTSYEYTVSIYFPGDLAAFGAVTINMNVWHHLGSIANNIDIPITNSYIYANNYNIPSIAPLTYYISAGTEVILSSNILSPLIEGNSLLSIGTEIQNWLQASISHAGILFDVSTSQYVIPSSPNYPQVKITYGNTGNTTANFFKNSPVNQLDEGMTVDINSFIPQKIKQKEFIAGIVKMFNLYITPDKNQDKNLIIQTRDEFYDSGKTLDWTDKFSVDNEAKIQFLPDLQNKKILFTYKSDSDVYNKDYNSNYRETYGQLEVEFANEFVKETKRIEPLFSPTPMNENLFGLIVPTITSIAPKNNIRILYDGGWINALDSNNLQSSWQLKSQTGSTITYTFNSYPYMGHFDNPLQPLNDWNFGICDEYYYALKLTNNNLYNKYYQRFISQIVDGKLLTARFKLNATDILNLDFRDKIFIHDSYWYINKIVDYNANSKEGLTTVELINVEDGLTFSPTLSTEVKEPNNTSNNLGNDETLFNGDILNSFGTKTSFVQVLGTDNAIQPNSAKSVILGDNNNVAVNKTMIIGTGNTVSGNQMMVMGNNNFIGPSLSNVFIIGDNVTATNSNQLIIGDNVDISNFVGEEITYADIITAIANSELSTGRFYKIIDRGASLSAPMDDMEVDNGLIIQATSSSTLAPTGIRRMLVPSTYVIGLDAFNNNWLGIWTGTLSPSIDDLVIWGGMVWKNVNGNVGSNIDNYTLDAEWTLVSRASYGNFEYTELQLICGYDVTNNWITKQIDEINNYVGINWLGVYIPNPCSATDWNLKTTGNQFYNNYAPTGFYNNILVNDFYSNLVQQDIINNIARSISRNIGIEFIRTNQLTGNMFNNSNKGNIQNNVAADITGNINIGNIESNIITNDITDNSNLGNIDSNVIGVSISKNSNLGNITNNNTPDPIWYNSNNGIISNNVINGPINHNQNIGGIYSNTTSILGISYNSNSGDIYSNAGSPIPILIEYNINNGYITGTHAANVTDPIVNK